MIAPFPTLSSIKEKDLIKLSRAVRHIERYSATDTKRGRSSRWPREDLVKIGLNLSEVLRRETSGRIAVATFVDHYLRMLGFPSDVLEWLIEGDINLFEAEQLARITAARLGISPGEAKRKRKELLAAHLGARSSGERLRHRVNDVLKPAVPEGIPSAPPGTRTEAFDELEDFDPYDSTHLFWEEIKQLGFAFREIRREDLSDDLLEELFKAAEPVWAVLRKIKSTTRRSL
jgi:hypothetical protein